MLALSPLAWQTPALRRQLWLFQSLAHPHRNWHRNEHLNQASHGVALESSPSVAAMTRPSVLEDPRARSPGLKNVGELVV